MDHAHLITQLTRHREVFRAMLSGLTDAEIRWKPAPEKWCLLEIVCHLHDEEREDFRARLHGVLNDPAAPWPKIDPVAWVEERGYMAKNFDAMLDSFLNERDRSLEWLGDLKAPRWDNAYPHPKVGPVRASLLLVNWVAHDIHHIRQINDLRYGHLASISSEPLDYAGKW